MNKEIEKLSHECTEKIIHILDDKKLKLPEVDEIVDKMICYFVANSLIQISHDKQFEYLKYRLMNISERLCEAAAAVHNVSCPSNNNESSPTIH